MTTNPDPVKAAVTEVVAGVIDPACAPIIYFDFVSNLGHVPGVINLTLAADRMLLNADGAIRVDKIAVAFLRCNFVAAARLRDSIDKALLAAMPVQEGQAN